MTFKQHMRAKHQVLILKCYPKLPKNPPAAEIKPNGSELSYLMYYASSRQSKLSKIGTFLERKVTHDLYKLRTASVQITLQILTAFLNNSAIGGGAPQGFGLFAPYVLRILDEVLRDANEAVLVETAVPTWDSFCKHQDHVTLSADAQYGALYASVVRQWAGYATKEVIPAGTGAEKRAKMRVGVTDNVKLRMAGLEAIRSTVESDTLATEAGRQLSTILPVVLQNIYDCDTDLDKIMQLNAQYEHQEKERMSRSRPSMMSIHEPSQEDRDPRVAETTVDEADRLADQEASLLALRCLRSVFTFENRAQIRGATNVVLRYIVSHSHVKSKSPGTLPGADGADGDGHWTVKLFKTICTWTPVQDRFIAVFAAVEMLITSSNTDDDLRKQVMLTRIISSLLSSDINLIGLSIMDVLLALLQHTLRQLQPAPAVEGASGDTNAVGADQQPANAFAAPTYANTQASPLRTHLLFRLQQCISHLAVHVYYTDQISDMVVAIVLRLKPASLAAGGAGHLQVPTQTSSNSPSGASAAGDNDSRSVSDAGANSISSPRASTRTAPAGFFFSTPTAREMALNAISQIIQCANKPSQQLNYVATHRNPVPLQVWEGTAWLLRDPEASVREAYIRAFKTWLDEEMPKLALHDSTDEDAAAELDFKRKSLSKELAKRAANSASARKAANLRIQTTVLQTIHLAVVDALQSEAATSMPSVAPAFDVKSPSINSFTTARDTRSPPPPGSPPLDRDARLSPLATPTTGTFFNQVLMSDSDSSTSLGALEAVLSAVSADLNLPSLEEFRASQPANSTHSPRNMSNTGPPSPQDDPRRPSLAQSISRSAALAAAVHNTGSDRTDFAALAPPVAGVSHAGELPVSASVNDLKRLLHPSENGGGGLLHASHSSSAVRSGSHSSSVVNGSHARGTLGKTSSNGHRDASRSHSVSNFGATTSKNGSPRIGTDGYRSLNSAAAAPGNGTKPPSSGGHPIFALGGGGADDGSGAGTPVSKAQSVRSGVVPGQQQPPSSSWPLRNGTPVPPPHGVAELPAGDVDAAFDQRSVIAHSTRDGDADSMIEYGGSWVSFNGDPDRVLYPLGSIRAGSLRAGGAMRKGTSLRAGNGVRGNKAGGLDIVGLLSEIGVSEDGQVKGKGLERDQGQGQWSAGHGRGMSNGSSSSVVGGVDATGKSALARLEGLGLGVDADDGGEFRGGLGRAPS